MDEKLSLKLSKTKCIVFGNREINFEVKIRISDVEIERVYDSTFLGVIIDHNLSWKPHINHIKSKTNEMSKSIAILNKAKNILNQKSLLMLYGSLIVPYITYCVEVWGNTN